MALREKTLHDVNLAKVPHVPLGWVAALAAGRCSGRNEAARFTARTLREGWFRRARPHTICRVFVQATYVNGYSDEILRTGLSPMRT
jgi:hypothetical protein